VYFDGNEPLMQVMSEVMSEAMSEAMSDLCMQH
jgi:hypothetical protein